jgi:PKD repeat protein
MGSETPPPRVRWLLILLALLIIAASAVALQTIDDSPTDTTQAGEESVEAGAPDASFTHTCESMTCSFQDESTDDGTVADWTWSFGDGETWTDDASAVHAYSEPGVYRVSLTVTDDTGNVDTVTRSVSLGAPPDREVPVSDTAPPVYPFGPHIGSSGGWELVADPFTSAHINGYRDTVIEELNAARADGKTLILHLPGTTGDYRNPDGTFNLDLWKAGVDEFADIDFTPWIEDGTLLVHYLISEPMSRSRWGGEVVTVEVLDEMARYSKQLWPNLPTTVREQPTDLILHAGGYETPVDGWEWTYLDSGWARYLARKGPVDEFIETEVAAAKAQGLGLLFGMNVLSGGDGSSGQIGYDEKYVMSAEEVVRYGTELINEPYGCAMIMWHLNFDDIPYFTLPQIETAMEQLGQVARARDPIPCS